MAAELLLTFDVGTTAVKSVLWDTTIRPLAVHRQEYSLQTVDDRVEVSPGRYRELIAHGAREVLDGVDAGRVSAICLTTQGETLVPVDREGRPLGPAIVWLDARASAEAQALRERFDADHFYRHTGIPLLDGTAPLAKAAQLAPLLHRTHGARLLLLEDYLVQWLTGRTVTNRSLQTSTGWFDLETDDYWDEALLAAGLDRELLPELLDSGQRIGTLLPGVAAELGLDPTVVVVSGAMDQAAAALGTGLSEPGVLGVSFGTALVVAGLVSGPADAAAPRPTVYRNALPGPMLGILFEPTSGALLRWLRTLLDPDGSGRPSYADLDALAAHVAPGSGGVLALPLFGGADGPSRGALLGLGLGSDRAQLWRSLLEATSFALRELVDAFAAFGAPVTELRSSGGGSGSPLWQAIAADICEVPVRPLPFGEAASTGAALLCAWGAGLVPSGTDPRPLAEGELFRPLHSAEYSALALRHRAATAALDPFWAVRP
jgi:xylulokinase